MGYEIVGFRNESGDLGSPMKKPVNSIQTRYEARSVLSMAPVNWKETTARRALRRIESQQKECYNSRPDPPIFT